MWPSPSTVSNECFSKSKQNILWLTDIREDHKKLFALSLPVIFWSSPSHHGTRGNRSEIKYSLNFIAIYTLNCNTKFTSLKPQTKLYSNFLSKRFLFPTGPNTLKEGSSQYSTVQYSTIQYGSAVLHSCVALLQIVSNLAAKQTKK